MDFQVGAGQLRGQYLSGAAEEFGGTLRQTKWNLNGARIAIRYGVHDARCMALRRQAYAPQKS